MARSRSCHCSNFSRRGFYIQLFALVDERVNDVSLPSGLELPRMNASTSGSFARSRTP